VLAALPPSSGATRRDPHRRSGATPPFLLILPAGVETTCRPAPTTEERRVTGGVASAEPDVTTANFHATSCSPPSIRLRLPEIDFRTLPQPTGSPGQQVT